MKRFKTVDDNNFEEIIVNWLWYDWLYQKCSGYGKLISSEDRAAEIRNVVDIWGAEDSGVDTVD